MNEGSVEVDEGATLPEAVEETQDESSEIEESSEESYDESSEEAVEEGQDEPQLTEKGTKLDPNPMSAAYQELANERAQRRQYEQVLNNPEVFKRYAQQMGLTVAEAKAEVREEAHKWSADNIQTADDLANALNQMQTSFSEQSRSYEQKIQELSSQLYGLSESRQVEQVANTMQSDVNTVREKYPELNPKSSQYDRELEREVGELYHELDFDPRSGAYRGNVSIASIADRFMRASGRAKKAASREAQTQVRQKSAGKVVTSSKATNTGKGESSDPGTAIAQRIAKAMGQ